MDSVKGVDLAAAYVPEDSYFGASFIDRDEERKYPHSHRYIHGGFAGTDTRFSIYFPPIEGYKRRFFTSIEGGPGGHEDRAAAMPPFAGLHGIDFAATYGAFMVETNGGHIGTPGLSRGRSLLDGDITTFRASAESTRFARWLSERIYGEVPLHGYIFGPSGGGWRTILCIENTRGIWEGAVPYISPAGLGVSFPSIISNLVRVLGDNLPAVVAAFEPGGSGDPFSGLTSRQRLELATAYRAGLQPGAEFQLLRPAPELNVLLTTSVMHADFDPEYFEDFWTKPGYLGADGDLEDESVDTTIVVKSLATVGELRASNSYALDYFISGGLSLDDTKIVGVHVRANEETPRLSHRARGCAVAVTTGANEGSQFACLGAVDDIFILDEPTGDALSRLAEGDELQLNNRRYLAYCFAYRHQVDVDAQECRQFMVGDQPIYPQREKNVADVLAGVRTTGNIEAKVIYVSNAKDTLASPLGGSVEWAGKVRSTLGPLAHEHLRVWVNDNAAHLTPQRRPPGDIPVASTRLVDWIGIAERAVDDVIAWVEEGTAPPSDTNFTVDDGYIQFASTAAERGGVQPIVSALANGSVLTQVGVGESVELNVQVAIPANAGAVRLIEWDFDGSGTWPYREKTESSETSFSTRKEFSLPGTYYPSVRITIQGPKAVDERYGLIRNLARVRVDVI